MMNNKQSMNLVILIYDGIQTNHIQGVVLIYDGIQTNHIYRVVLIYDEQQTIHELGDTDI